MTSPYAKKLTALKTKGRLRRLCPLEQQGNALINLSSNDYLGLGRDAALRTRFYKETDPKTCADFGFAATSSRLLTGDFTIAHQLEQELSETYQREAVLLFNSGYHANIGILPALFGKGDLILSDKLNHASIHDGLILSRADHKRYHHCDYIQLRNILSKYRKQYDRVVIVTESVFSMDGDVADLTQLVQIKNEFDGALYLDEAHAVGVYGEKGLGKAEELGVVQDIDFLVGTFGKAWASIGAFVCCSSEVRNFLINHSRSLIFTTALPPITLAWNHFVFRQSLGMVSERQALQQLSDLLRQALAAEGIMSTGSTTIVPVLIGSDNAVLTLSESLKEHGFLALPVRPPTVPEGTARFRFSLCANMQWQDIQNLPEILSELLHTTAHQ